MPLLKNKNWWLVRANGFVYLIMVSFMRGKSFRLRDLTRVRLCLEKRSFRKTGLWDLTRLAADTEFITRLKLVFGREKLYRLSSLWLLVHIEIIL